MTFLIFRWFGFSINVMTLGGLAVALGELVDDAIVDVENILRRLRENARLEAGQRRTPLAVIYTASSEVRSAIINSTVIVILVFIPLFALSGIEGRMFTPLGVAYIVSILASTVVSLTVTPVLSWYLLPQMRGLARQEDSWLIQVCKALVRPVVRVSMSRGGYACSVLLTVALVLASGSGLWRIGKDFLPKFDEGASQVNLFLPPGASLTSSRRVSELAEQRLSALLKTSDNPAAPLLWFTSKSGRAEDDEHVMGVNVTEITVSLNPDNQLSHDDLVDLLTDTVGDIPGATLEIEQPIGHLVGHMLSGISAEIGVKLFGDDLGTLQDKAVELVALMSQIGGLTEPIAEQQQMVPQLRIELNREQLARYGLTTNYVNQMIETAMGGQIIDQVLLDQRAYDLFVRFDEPWRSDIDNLRRMPIEAPDGTRVPLSEIAGIYTASGPNTIKRENSRRRIIVRVNTNNRDLVSAVREIDDRLKQQLELPPGYYAEMGGEFQAQQSATRQILLLGGVALAGIFVVLFATFRSARLVLQILVALPVGMIGGTAGLLLTGQTLSIAATVGFVSLGGIAIRNGILLIEAYRRRLEGTDPHDRAARRQAIVDGSLDRLAPVLMTTLTTGCALIPLVLGGHEPGKEILYPVATVILGGLITSTIAEYILRPGLFYFWTLAENPGEHLEP
jgi:CzcA family heavy metal efflux pump